MPKRGKATTAAAADNPDPIRVRGSEEQVLGTRKKTKRNQASKQANKHDLLFKVFEYSLWRWLCSIEQGKKMRKNNTKDITTSGVYGKGKWRKWKQKQKQKTDTEFRARNKRNAMKDAQCSRQICLLSVPFGTTNLPCSFFSSSSMTNDDGSFKQHITYNLVRKTPVKRKWEKMRQTDANLKVKWNILPP